MSEANAGKALTVQVEGSSFARIPIRTRVVMPGDDLDDFIRDLREEAAQIADKLVRWQPPPEHSSRRCAISTRSLGFPSF